MFTKIGVTVATGALPVLLWAGAAGAQVDPCQSQSQSQSQQCNTSSVPATSVPTGVLDTGSGTGTLARTGADDLIPLALGGVALGGAIAVRRGLRRRSLA